MSHEEREVKDKTGGPAFPYMHEMEDYRQAAFGMSLRDYFAAAALIGSVSRSLPINEADVHAAWAYQLADAMLTEREKG